MSKAAAQAFYDRSTGEPAAGYIAPDDHKNALGVVYDDMTVLAAAAAAARMFVQAQPYATPQDVPDPQPGDLFLWKTGHLDRFDAGGWLASVVNLSSGFPVGTVTPFAGATAPVGWLLCAGQTVSRTTYAALFAAIGTGYNTGGEAGTVFRLPDLRGRVPAGVDNMGGAAASRLDWANTPGTAGGEQKHLLTAAESGVPPHAHPITDPGHTHTYDTAHALVNQGTQYDMTGVTGAAQIYNTGSRTTGITVNNAAAAPAASPHNVMQPTLLLNYIIRADA